MTTPPFSPIDLFASSLHIHPNGDVRTAGPRTASRDAGAWHIATFHVASDADVHADHWEMHPEADEAVCCLTGGLRIYFRPTTSNGTEDMVHLRTGTAAIVPRGRWHRLELDEPSDLMSMTLRHGTRLEKRTEAR
ncbi:cupin [Streptomyces sp. NPDC057375]|uniref:cupin n=1 Tax=Streptomyces sp. NPDC057375 TaxID=3346109 RepID=UPI00362D494E